MLSIMSVINVANAVSSSNIPAVPKFDADVIKIRSMFESKEYKKLNALLENYQDMCEKDIRWEVALQNGFGFFFVANPAFISRLNMWVDNTPGSWVPFLARAAHYEKLAYNARGYGWAKDTSENQFNRMREYLALGVRDVDVALKKNPKRFYAHLMLLRFGKNIGEFQGDMIAKKALDIYPSSFLLRGRYMEMLEPRWGGSYEEMNKFASESVPFAKMNPIIMTLKGSAYADMADLAFKEGNGQLAIDLYERALSYGDNFFNLFSATDVYLDLNKTDKALDAINRAIALRPMVATGHVKRAKVLSYLMRYKEAIDALDTADILGGIGSDEVPATRKWINNQLTNNSKPALKKQY
jgi:tetratricopeptide (TPR) repeat protein